MTFEQVDEAVINDSLRKFRECKISTDFKNWELTIYANMSPNQIKMLEDKLGIDDIEAYIRYKTTEFANNYLYGNVSTFHMPYGANQSN